MLQQPAGEKCKDNGTSQSFLCQNFQIHYFSCGNFCKNVQIHYFPCGNFPKFADTLFLLWKFSPRTMIILVENFAANFKRGWFDKCYCHGEERRLQRQWNAANWLLVRFGSWIRSPDPRGHCFSQTLTPVQLAQRK